MSTPHTDSTADERAVADGLVDGKHAATAEIAPGAPAPPADEPPSRRRRRLIAACALIIVVVAVAIAVLVSSSSGSHKGAGSSVPAGETTTTVTRRTLSESSTVDGTLAYGAALELYDRVAGTYTWLPAVGTVVARGATLWRIDNLPVVLMYGAVPAYRTLKQGVSSGPDVVQLNRNLIDLGFDFYGAITDVDVYSEATADAVRRFQHAHGLRETGEVELGRVVFAPSARRVTAVHVQLGQDPPGEGPSDGSTSPAAESPAGKSPSKESPAAKSPSAKSPSRKSPSKHPTSTKSPSKDSPAAKSPSKDSPAAKSPSGESQAAEDDGAAAAEAALSTTPTQQLVQLKLKPSQQELVHTGQSAPVTLPSGSVVEGRVIEVGSVASEAAKGNEPGGGGESESATIPVTLALERSIPHLDEAPVSVEFVKAVRRDVLAVPATALTATAGNGYALEALQDGRRVQLPVTTGMFANGYVQAEGAGVQEGLTVLESE